MLSPKNQLSNVKVEQNAEIQSLLQEKIHARALPFQQHCAEAIAVRFTDLRPLRTHSMLGIEYPGHLSDNGRTSPRLSLLSWTASVDYPTFPLAFLVSPASPDPASCISPSAAVLTFEPSEIRRGESGRLGVLA